MRSIPIAMTWELLRRGRWYLLLGLVGANLLPLILLTALRIDNAIYPNEPQFITIQVVLVQIHIFTFGAALLAFHEITPRQYTMPVTSSTLVTWRLLPAMVLMSLEQIVSTILLNKLFGLNWPFWGPALLAPVTLAIVLSGLWYAQQSPSQPIYVIISGTLIGLWYKSRCGPVFSLPTHMWSTVTAGEILTLCGAGLAAYFVSVAGINRGRRGESPEPMLLLHLLTLDVTAAMPPATPRRAFHSAKDAQFWFEWNKKGLVLPMVVVLALSVAVAMWLVFSRDPYALLEGLIAGGMLLSGGGMLGGLVIGNSGSTDADLDMGQFLATRPMTSRDLAMTLLKVAFRSVVISWSLWAAAFGVVTAIIMMTGGNVVTPVLGKVWWWYFPATLAACWVVVTSSACMALTGRGTLWAKLFGAVLPVCLIVMLLTQLLDRELQDWLFSIFLCVSGASAAGFAAWTMMAARSRMLIDSRVVVSAGLVWAVLASTVIFESLRHSGNHVPLTVFIAGLAAWVVAPLSATPLAICANRHR